MSIQNFEYKNRKIIDYIYIIYAKSNTIVKMGKVVKIIESAI